MTCSEKCRKSHKPSQVSRDIVIFTLFLLVLVPILAYFVQKKVENDTNISRDTARIADTLEKISR